MGASPRKTDANDPYGRVAAAERVAGRLCRRYAACRRRGIDTEGWRPRLNYFAATRLPASVLNNAACAPHDGITPFQGYGDLFVPDTQGCTLGYRITPLRG